MANIEKQEFLLLTSVKMHAADFCEKKEWESNELKETYYVWLILPWSESSVTYYQIRMKFPVTEKEEAWKLAVRVETNGTRSQWSWARRRSGYNLLQYISEQISSPFHYSSSRYLVQFKIKAGSPIGICMYIRGSVDNNSVGCWSFTIHSF
jgi:hypothetical protein